MPFDTNIRRRLKQLLLSGDDFALYCLPDSDVVQFADSVAPLHIVPWMTRAEERISIGVKAESSCRQNAMAVCTETTDRKYYIESVGRLIDCLRQSAGKTVISRTTCGSMASVDPIEVAERYFDLYPSCFRYLYNSAYTGAWLGASPELLLEYDGKTSMRTMSLAGTRRAGQAGSWDDKNIEEQAFVTRFIVDCLQSMPGASVTASPAASLRYGIIEHLCSMIEANLKTEPDVSEIMTVLDKLSPTPALCGYPRADALGHISAVERHERGCYGGYLMLENRESGGFKAWVNLRCAHFDNNRWCIISGGGITSHSVADDEWQESEAKASVLKKLFQAATTI